MTPVDESGGSAQASGSERLAATCVVAGIVLLPFQRVGLGPVTPSDVLFLVAFVAGVCARLVTPSVWGWPAVSARVAIAAGLFAGGAVASAAVNGGSWVKLVGHLELVAIGLMTAMVARYEGGRRLLLRALAAAGAVAAVLALVGVALWSLGRPTGLVHSHFGDLVPGPYPRVRATLVSPNMLASLLATGALLLFFEPGIEPRRWLRRAGLGAMLLAMPFTFSRTIPAVALALTTSLRRRLRRRGWFWALWGAGVALLFVGLFLATRYAVRLDPLDPLAASLDAGTPGTRWRFAAAVLARARSSPWLGLGPTPPAALAAPAHFTWLNLWARLGIVPLVAFAFLFVLALRAAIRRGLPGVGWALGVLLVDSLHRDVEDMRHLWVLLGVALALAPSASAEVRRSEGQERA